MFQVLSNTVRHGRLRAALALVLCGLLPGGTAARAQSSGTQQVPPPSSSPSTQSQNPTEQVPEAGGPQGNVSPVVVPKKKEEPPPPPKPKFKTPEGLTDYSLQVNVPLVTLPVTVLAKDGAFIPGLKKENFKVLEDGVPQKITNFAQTDAAPITAVILVEFAAGYYSFINDMLMQAYGFASTLKPSDWIAVISYDMHPEIQQDFTQDKMAVVGALNHLRIPGFRETNLFDSLYFTLDRVERVPGHKYIILISSGVDTFSKLNFDQAVKKVEATRDVSIYAISTGWVLREWLDTHGAITPGRTMPGTADVMTYLQADNEMKTFANLTGGRFYQPRFQGQMREVVADISNSIRNEYSVAYHSSNPKEDGSYRKIKVELVDAETGGPINMRVNGKKETKYNIITREGYTAKHVVE